MKSIEQKVTEYYGEQAVKYIDQINEGLGRYQLSKELGCSRWQARQIINIVDSHSTEPPEIEGVTSKDELDIQDIYDRSVKAFERKENLAERRANQRIKFPEKEICICFGGDEHFGNAGTDVERAFNEAEIIAGTSDMYAWKMGDLVDNFIVGYLVAKNVDAPIQVREQWALAKAYLELFNESLIASVGGNHDAWSSMMSHVDKLKSITPKGILYDQHEIKADVIVGDAKFPVKARHKWPGSSIYNDTHGQERDSRFNDQGYTIYVGAHLHRGCSYREFNLDGYKRAAILTGTYKKHDDYKDKMGFKNNDNSTVCPVIFRPDGTFDKMNLKHAANHMNNLNA